MRKFFRRRADASTDAGNEDNEEPEAFPEGLKALHEPSFDKAPLVDLVFVHGLTGDRKRTWTHPSADDLWPRAYLPQFIPNARILTYGYDAYVARSCSPVSRTRVSDHAKDFLTALAHDRSENPERP